MKLDEFDKLMRVIRMMFIGAVVLFAIVFIALCVWTSGSYLA